MTDLCMKLMLANDSLPVAVEQDIMQVGLNAETVCRGRSHSTPIPGRLLWVRLIPFQIGQCLYAEHIL